MLRITSSWHSLIMYLFDSFLLYHNASNESLIKIRICIIDNDDMNDIHDYEFIIQTK